MKTNFTATIAASAIALTSITASPATALTQDEILALFVGAAAIAILTSSGPTSAPTPTPPPIAVTYSTGPINLKQTYSANFDNGTIGGAGSDIWFQAATPTRRYLTPRNGAMMAVGDRTNRGFAGCSTASFSYNRVRLNRIPVGSYVCMKTSAGRISQFRVNRIVGGAVKKLKLGYTTWR